MKKIVLLVVVSLFYVAISVFGQSQTEDVTIRSHNDKCDPNTLPFLVALGNDYFEKNGINVILIDDPSNVAIDDKDNILMTGRGVLYKHEARYPNSFKIFTIGFQDESRWNDAVLVGMDSDITSLNQLKGKTIGVEVALYIARFAVINAMLEKNGIDPSEVSIVGSSLEDFLAKKVDALYIREPHLTLYLESGIGRMLVEGPLYAKYIMSPWPMGVAAFSTEFLAEKPNVAKKIVSIWDKAIGFIEEHPEEAKKILQSCVEREYGQKVEKMRLVNHWASDEIDKNVVQKQVDWYYNSTILPRELNADDILLKVTY